MRGVSANESRQVELASHPTIGERRERQIAKLVLYQFDVDEVRPFKEKYKNFGFENLRKLVGKALEPIVNPMVLAATVQNLRKLAKLIRRRPNAGLRANKLTRA